MSNCNYDPLTIEAWNTYTNNYEDTPEVNAMKRRILDSAIQVVEEYIGYPILASDQHEEFTGVEGRKLYLHGTPITFVYDVILNGEHMSEGFGFVWNPECLYFDRPLKPKDAVFVHYSSGWSKNQVPALITQTVYRIATLMLTEANGNIGITSSSYSDGSRSFVNYQNYQKFLSPLRGFKTRWV